jgi:DNA-binding MarR family transcriptional regulator
MSVKELAHAANIDAPAATVAINDLEERGLVVRQADPSNRRTKTVSLTDAGRAMVRKMGAINDPAPDILATLDDAELKSLQAILEKLVAT